MVVCYFVSVVNVLSLSHVLSLLTRGHNSHEPIVEGLNIRLCLSRGQPPGAVPSGSGRLH